MIPALSEHNTIDQQWLRVAETLDLLLILHTVAASFLRP